MTVPKYCQHVRDPHDRDEKENRDFEHWEQHKRHLVIEDGWIVQHDKSPCDGAEHSSDCVGKDF